MKFFKAFLLITAVLTMSFSVKADYDKVITFSQLPAAAQEFLKQHFADKVPQVVTVDHDDYTIVYDSGEKVEFDKQGNWKEIECRTSSVPAALIPDRIVAHVNATYPGATIIDLDRSRGGYEVSLSNGLDIEYNTQFQVIDVDD